MPPIPGQLVADAGNHVVEAADIRVDVELELGLRDIRINLRLDERQAQPFSALFHDLGDVCLDVAAEAGPVGLGAAERDQIVEVGMAGGKGGELVVVVEFGLMPRAVDQPDVFPVAAVGPTLWKQPLRKTAHGRDAGSGGDQDGVGDRLFQDEVSVRAVNLDAGAGFQIGEVGEVVGEKAAFNPVDAQVEAISVRSRCNRIGARLLLAVLVRGHGGDELAGGEREALELVQNELEVVALRGFRDQDFLFKTCGIGFPCQGGSRFKEE